jgi:DNA-binding response OmpR family regulator
MTGAATDPQGPTILLYSDDVDVRDQVRLALGRRLGRGEPDIVWVETATAAQVDTEVRHGRFDLLILDGEASKVGGMGIARQVKDEVYDAPPVLVLIARPQDAWLAAWSDADAVVAMPLDPAVLHEAVVGLLAGAANR